MNINDINIKIFADSANFTDLVKIPFKVSGITTNPSIARKSGISNYREWAKSVVAANPDIPISIEILSDDLNDMESEARKIAAIGENVYVTIPITNTEGSYTHRVIERLSNDGIPVNVTAIFTPEQVMAIEPCLSAHTPSIVSIFAGCISDTGRDPAPILEEALWILERKPQTELLWHGCREVYNIIQANNIGCHIISVPDSILKKLDLLDYDLEKFSLDMVRQFYDDAVAADFTL